LQKKKDNEMPTTSSNNSLPVVWCADRNSADNKPTAFALQGIHLQGNISEQHVLAVRELINAASEGRLLLPADGGVVMLSCGAGVGSLIVSSNDDAVKAKSLQTDDDTKQQQFNIYDRKEEVLYEFLCCARCMTEGSSKCANKCSSQNSRVLKKYLDARMNGGKAIKRSAYLNKLRQRKRNKNSFKNDKRLTKRFNSNLGAFPIYATINKANKTKKVANDVSVKNNDQFSATAMQESFRKTSFDSTCTISSMDSGFMEMQSKIELVKSNVNMQIINENVQIKIDTVETQNEENNVEIGKINSWNRLTVSQQSRNRRKSYEEFKSLFCDQKNLHSIACVDSKTTSSKSRRKSYEEFKSVTNALCDNSSAKLNVINNNNNSSSNSNSNTDTSSKSDDNFPSFFNRMRRGSKRFSQKNIKSSIKKVNQEKSSAKGFTIYDILHKTNYNDKNVLEFSEDNKKNYDKNLELFESHCNQQSLKSSCGTIYDIIQGKSDINQIKKYDKYMTYGTLYEILHRKSDEGEQFERIRTFSEKFTNKQRINYDLKSKIENPNSGEYKKSTSVTDTNEKNLNSTSTTTSTSSLKQGSCNTNNQLSANSKQLSTIYDILQTKKLETNGITIQPNNKNRFLVRKITEEELIEFQKENDTTDGTANSNVVKCTEEGSKNETNDVQNS
jgi:hypothetical protein